MVISSLFSFTGFSQEYQAKSIDYEGLELHSPMEIELILAGNFGEMRSNHFHTGLDIKTKGVEGQKILSVEDGYISRVRVSPWGYGNALYIDHPNGLTSLYAHLRNFPPEIDSFIHSWHIKTESGILDEIVLTDSFFVKKGELIAYSGNSGSSFAAHLHFELRETVTEHALNPLRFACYQEMIKDKTKPRVSGIKIYAISDKGYMIPGKSKYYSCTLSGNKWVVNNNKPIDVSSLATRNSKLGIGFHVTDKLDGAGNICGVYNTILSKGDSKKHEQRMEYINFDHNRFLNAHQDYNAFHENKKNIHKNFTTVINLLPIYPKNDGKIDWNDCAGKYTFKAEDAHGNIQTIFFTLAEPRGSYAKNPFDKVQRYYFPDSVNTLLREDFQLLMEPATFYEPLKRYFKIDSNSRYLSPKYIFSEYEIPVHQRYDVRIKVASDKSDLPPYKLGIGLISDKGYLSFKGGNYVDGWVEATSRSFGTFVLVIDTIAPKINPLDFRNGKVISKYRNLQLEILDNLSGVKVYKAYLNEHWVLMTYDRRERKYIIPLDKYSKPFLKKGDNQVKIYAKDKRGNDVEAEWKIIY